MIFALRGVRYDPKPIPSFYTEKTVLSLRSLCTETTLQKLVRDVADNEDRNVWQSSEMVHNKQVLNSVLPSTVLEELYRELFSIAPDAKRHTHCSHLPKRGCQIQLNWKEKLNQFSGKKLFNLWWLFLDETYTKKLEVNSFVFYDGNFNLELISYLAEVKTVLNSLHLSYNWILKADYLKLFQQQIFLRHLTLYGEINDSFLDLIGNNLSLLSLSFGEEATFQRTTVRKFVDFLDTQSECLEELSWNASDSLFQLNSLWSRNSNDILKSIVRLRRLVRLQLHSHWIKFLDVSRSLCQLEHLTLHSAKVHHFSKMTVETFPRLKSLSLNLTINEQDDLTFISDFCANNPKTIIGSIKAVIFNVHPFKLLSNVYSATSVILKYGYSKNENGLFQIFSPTAVELRMPPLLTELRIEAEDNQLYYQDFKLIWSSIASLTKVAIHLNNIFNFDENDFVDFIPSSKATLSNVMHIDLRITSKSVVLMTGKSLVAILQSCKNLKTFENFLYFEISSDDRVKLTTLAAKLGLTIVSAKKIGSVWCSEGEHF